MKAELHVRKNNSIRRVFVRKLLRRRNLALFAFEHGQGQRYRRLEHQTRPARFRLKHRSMHERELTVFIFEEGWAPERVWAHTVSSKRDQRDRKVDAAPICLRRKT